MREKIEQHRVPDGWAVGYAVVNISKVRKLESDFELLENFDDGVKDVIADLENNLKIAVDALEDSDSTICRLCRVINPQHSDCTQCGERDDLLGKIKQLKGDES